jgi:hypothetical protein
MDPSRRLDRPPSPAIRRTRQPALGLSLPHECAFAMPRCADTPPPLLPLAADHHVACYLYDGA